MSTIEVMVTKQSQVDVSHAELASDVGCAGGSSKDSEATEVALQSREGMAEYAS